MAVQSIEGLPSLADVVDRVTPWVVSITTEVVSRGRFTSFTEEGAGSGFVVRPNGYIVTNNHVIRGAREIQVHLPNGQTYDAVVTGTDPTSDLAVLKIEAENLPMGRFADMETIRVGNWVLTMGNALALKGGPTVTLGIISGLGRSITTAGGDFYDLVQTDAAINTGNSGGPLLNLEGEVVGINQAIMREGTGVGFAISSDTASPIINSLIEEGRFVRPIIGLIPEDFTPAIASQLRVEHVDGVIVTQTNPAGPSHLAGIRAGDVITRMDDVPTPDKASFLNLLWSYDVGDQVQIEYVHEGDYFNALVELAE